MAVHQLNGDIVQVWNCRTWFYRSSRFCSHSQS